MAFWNGFMEFYALTQYILRVKTDYDGLIIDPCIPTILESFKMKRKFRGQLKTLRDITPNMSVKVSKG